MKLKIFLVIILGLLIFNPSHRLNAQENLPPVPKGPLLLTSTTPEQLNPDYWINRLPEPDRVLKTPEQLAVFNEDAAAMVKELRNIFKMQPTMKGEAIRSQIQLEYRAVSGRGLYDVDDHTVPKSWFESNVRPQVQWEKIPDTIRLKWGVAIQPTAVRSLPTDVKLLEKKQDYEFDMLQFTLIKLWTPVAIYHTSKDGEWFYIQAAYTRGWVRAQDIALFSNRDELEQYAQSRDFLMVTGESIPIYSDPSLQRVKVIASMGTRLPLTGQNQTAYEIWLPNRAANGGYVIQKAYVNVQSDVVRNVLAFTQRNIMTQAFKLLGARYGWAGMYHGRDCSAFIQDVFLTMGVNMPRSSKGQGFIGTQLSHFEYKEHARAKLHHLKQATPAITLLRMPAHMMLYLGEVNGQYYIIHSTWAERVSYTSDQKNRINQVVVSDLTLNGNSYLGSLFDRIISMNEID